MKVFCANEQKIALSKMRLAGVVRRGSSKENSVIEYKAKNEK